MIKNLRESLTRTRQSVFGQIAGVLGAGDITDETWDDLEALLIQADVGVPTTMYLVDRLRDRVTSEGIYQADALLNALKQELRAILVQPEDFALEEPRQLTVVMIVGVNHLPRRGH
ncbi:MAG: signal recognition particle receptor subunit alpha [Chloroflexota bacterium]